MDIKGVYKTKIILVYELFHYKVDNAGLIWIVNPKTGTETSVGQNRPIRNEQDAKEAAIDIITSSGLFEEYL